MYDSDFETKENKISTKENKISTKDKIELGITHITQNSLR